MDDGPWLQSGLFILGMHFRHETFGDRNPIERTFQEVKRRTEQFYNTFGRAPPECAENWLRAVSWAEKSNLTNATVTGNLSDWAITPVCVTMLNPPSIFSSGVLRASG